MVLFGWHACRITTVDTPQGIHLDYGVTCVIHILCYSPLWYRGLLHIPPRQRGNDAYMNTCTSTTCGSTTILVLVGWVAIYGSVRTLGSTTFGGVHYGTTTSAWSYMHPYMNPYTRVFLVHQVVSMAHYKTLRGKQEPYFSCELLLFHIPAPSVRFSSVVSTRSGK